MTESKGGKSALNSGGGEGRGQACACCCAGGGRGIEEKLSYKLQRELEMLPGQIDALEQRMAEAQEEVNAVGFYQRPIAETSAVLARIEKLQGELDVLVERWAELEG